MDDRQIWAPHPTEGYALGNIVDIGGDTVTVEFLATPGKTTSAPYNFVFPTEEYEKDVEDNCALMYLNEATLLNNIRIRYSKNSIYTYVANILIAINPYYEIKDLYAKPTIQKYQGKSLGVLPPHVFAIADKSYRDMKALKASQSIVVSGESGAGKTETTKYILKYLTECYGAHAGPIEQRIVESNPLLEAFGNAKTVRNNNSSRFGKFVEIHFDGRSLVTGGYISHYLLEKSRICVQATEERNYHIFYRMCAGAPDELRTRLGLASPDQFYYLKRGNTQFFCTQHTAGSVPDTARSQQYLKFGSLKDIQLDDVRDFKRTDAAMSDMGLDENEKGQIYAVVASVLHLGNIIFEDTENTQGGSRVTAATISSLSKAAELLGVDPNKLKESLTTRITQAARGGAHNATINIALRQEEASNARDALAKSVYARLFDHIVARVNEALPFTSSSSYIGVLDIAGFEYFQRNSFEQFCINYCNEKLQQFFNERVLKEEQLLYEKEGLGVAKITYTDNQDCIDLIETKAMGILDILDEESRLPKPVPDHFTTEVYAKNKDHYRLKLPRQSKLKSHREIRDFEGFLIRHFAGAVCYHTDQFIEKNNDALHASLEAIVQGSSSNLVQTLFQVEAQQRKPGTGKLNFISVGSKFRTQLNQLMDKLRSTGTNFIRCIKPNVKMVDHCFEGAAILTQLQCSGMFQVLDLMQQGYPSRARFDDLYNMYRSYLPPDLSRLDPRLFCKLLFKVLGLNDQDFKFGVSKVFFRPGKFAEFDQMLRADPENLAALVVKVKRWLIRYRWRKAQYCTWEVIKLKNKIAWRRTQLIKVQKTMKMWICVRRYRHRIRGLLRLHSLRKQLPSLTGVAGQLKQGHAEAMKDIESLVQQLDAAASKMRREPITQAAIDTTLTALLQAIDRQMKDLRTRVEKDKKREEEERLRKIQEAMELERRMKEEEEAKRRAEEEEKKKKLEMEERRRQEVAAMQRQEEEDRKAAEALQKRREEEAKKEEERARELEQERHDRELALRLTNEDATAVEDVAMAPGLLRSPAVLAQRQKQQEKKYDLSKWKYAELRDTINTSCDLELLAACREEFHRRLKVYHEWKQKNKKKGENEESRAPKSVVESATSERAMLAAARGSPNPSATRSTAANQNSDGPKHRFFRIPFSRPDGVSQSSPGTWWAHFEGKWIVRQMEIHPDQDPALYVAGVDDLKMTEVSLDETGLSRKKGAEVTERDFNREWSKYGGEALLKKYHNRISSQYLRQLFQ